MKRREFNALVIKSLAATLFCSCDKKREEGFYVWKSIAFDTEIEVTFVISSEVNVEKVVEQLSERTLEIEKLFSLYQHDSVINQLNKDGVLHNAPVEFVALIKEAQYYGDITHGLFDVTVQPLWDWHQGNSDKANLKEVLDLIGYKKIICRLDEENNSVKIPDGMKITLNGMIQGYLTDELTKVLKQNQVVTALTNAGEYKFIGDSSSGLNVVAIRGVGQKIMDTVKLSDGESLAVSAGYGYTFMPQDQGQGNQDNQGNQGNQGDGNAKEGVEQSHMFYPDSKKYDENIKSFSIEKTTVVRASSATTADVFATVATLSNKQEGFLKYVNDIKVFD